MARVIEFEDLEGLTCFGEVVAESDQGLEVYAIERTAEQGGKIWRYEDDWMTVAPGQVRVTVACDDASELREAWRDLGFVAAGDGVTLCLVEDEDAVNLVLFDDEPSDDEAGDYASENPKMAGYESDGFVAAEDDAEPFTFARAEELSPKGAAFVNEVHDAVRAFEQ
jgi:hypothetical protein